MVWMPGSVASWSVVLASHTPWRPASRAPMASVSMRSPTWTVSDGRTPMRVHAVWKITGSGLAAPSSPAMTRVSKKRAMPRSASLARWWLPEALVTAAILKPAARSQSRHGIASENNCHVVHSCVRRRSSRVATRSSSSSAPRSAKKAFVRALCIAS
jgi:hypothetical protein